MWIFFAVVSPSPISEAISGFEFFINGGSARWDRFFARGLLHGVVYALIGIGLVATQIMLRLIPISFECFFDASP